MMRDFMLTTEEISHQSSLIREGSELEGENLMVVRQSRGVVVQAKPVLA